MSARDVVNGTIHLLAMSMTGTGGPLTGKTVVVRIARRNGASTEFFDFDDSTWKTSAWTTKEAATIEIGHGAYAYLLDTSLLALSDEGQCMVLFECTTAGSLGVDEPHLVQVHAAGWATVQNIEDIQRAGASALDADDGTLTLTHPDTGDPLYSATLRDADGNAITTSTGSAAIRGPLLPP